MLADEALAHKAHLLHRILWGLVFLPLPYILYMVLEQEEGYGRALVLTGAGESVAIALLVTLRLGYVRLACILLVAASWLHFAAAAAAGRGVSGESYLLGLPLVIAMAGSLLGGRVALSVTALSLALGGLLVGAESRGLLIPTKTTSMTMWVTSVAIFPMVAGLQYLAERSLRKALDRARASEERYRLISRVSSDYVFSSEVSPEGALRLDWVAGAFEPMTGYSFEDFVMAGGWRAHLDPADVARDAEDLGILKRNQQVVTEVRTRTKSGELRWVRVYAHPVWDEASDRLAGIRGAVQDVTARKLAEAEREALIRELESKNVELERFTYTVSHDLKSPLVTIAGFVGHMEKDAISGNGEGVKASARRIRSAVTKMQALLSDLLSLSRIGRIANPSENVPFEGIAREAIELVRGRLEERKVSVAIEDGLPTVYVDRIRLVEVVQNLVDNAAKFMGTQASPRIVIGCRGEDGKGQPILFVSDNGAGIPGEFHERVFGLFNKLDPSDEGTGIGLALVRRIVEFHGGHVWVESSVGQGSTFCFTLATAPGGSREPAAPGRTA